MKLLITILTSYNEYILYESFKSIKNQIEHNIDYNISNFFDSFKSFFEKSFICLATGETSTMTLRGQCSGARAQKGINN